MAKLIPGINDLKTMFPEIAKEADGWDPSTISPGSEKKMNWKCVKNHRWNAVIYSRTGSQKTGCPYCSNQKVLPGFNDLQTMFPEIAIEAFNWDPTTLTSGSKQKKLWKCEKNHIWETAIKQRTRHGRGCVYCSNQKVLAGFNDLKTKYPEIAKEANGWDPSKVIAGSGKKMKWKCSIGHTYEATVVNRTNRKSGCPFCSNQKVLAGFNDLKTKYPEIAKEADGWDPSKVIAGSGKKMSWKCQSGHQWKATCDSRTTSSFREIRGKVIPGTNCPYCSNRKLLVGFNDLATRYPDVAQEADGWDPSKLIAGSAKRMKWKCSKGHQWTTTIDKRTTGGRNCPDCAVGGYSPNEPGWFYLMCRPGEQQLGITNYLEDRMQVHGREGWSKIDSTGPHDGHIVEATEKKYKKWLRTTVGTISGTTENWYTSKMEVHSLNDLREKSGIKTLIF